MKPSHILNREPRLGEPRLGEPRLGSQAGSVILEALIAILIFSIGILGLVGMQATAVSNVSDAKYRADAAFYANQIIGQMWASRVTQTNPAGVSYYAVDPTFAWPASGANATVITWAGQTGVAGALPNGTATIVIDPASQQQVTVTLNWQPPAASAVHVHTTVAYIN